MIELENIFKSFPMGDKKFDVLKGVDLQVAAGDLVSIMGKSGCGKSTLMNIIGLLDTPDSGTYQLENRFTANLKDCELSRLRAVKIGFVFQQFNLLPRLTALENTALPLVYAGVSKSEGIRRARNMLERVDMLSHQGHVPSCLSGGQQQRVAIARAMVARPSIILADEPTGALDNATGKEIMDLFIRLNREENTTCVVITHDPGVASMCNNCFTMRDGKVSAV
jgi:putative ABC transport system ATP-binding protein